MSRENWIILLVAIALVAGLTESGLTVGFFYALAGILILALYVSQHPATLVSARRRVPETHANIGEPISVEIEMEWRRRFSPGWVLVRDALPDSLESHLPSGRLFISAVRGRTGFTYRFSATHRGFYPIGPLSISCGDLFGITHNRSTQEELDFLTVYPRVFMIPEIRVPSNRPNGEETTPQRLFEDPSRMVGTRDYQPGDSLRRVHWKLTARTATLQSKVFEPSSTVEANILLNLHPSDYPRGDADIELACTVAASLAARLLMERQLVGILSNGNDAIWRYCKPDPNERHEFVLRADRSQAQLTQILSGIARLEPSSEKPLPEYLLDIHSRLPWTATLLIITHRIGEESARVLQGLKESGFALACVIVGAGDSATEATGRLASLGIPAAIVASEEQLATFRFRKSDRE